MKTNSNNKYKATIMKLANLLGSKRVVNSDVIPMVINEPHTTSAEDAHEESQKDDEKRMISISWGTGMPIDIIFNFIHKDFEEEGFQDALVNSDIAYRDAKERIIRNDLEMLFKRIILRYKNDIREVNVNIDNASKAYALTAACRLQARRETFEEHLLEINEMQTLLNNDDPKMLTMIESYRRGFQKGMAAVAINFIDKH